MTDFDLDQFLKKISLGIDYINARTEGFPEEFGYSELRMMPLNIAEDASATMGQRVLAASTLSRREEIYSEIREELRRPLWKQRSKRIHELLSDLAEEDRRLKAEVERNFALALNELRERVVDYCDSRLSRMAKMETNKEAAATQTEAVKLLVRLDLRHRICCALQSISGDAHEVAKILTPILIPLALAGTINIPLEPLVFSNLAVIIARMGVAALCPKNPKEKD